MFKDMSEHSRYWITIWAMTFAFILLCGVCIDYWNQKSNDSDLQQMKACVASGQQWLPVDDHEDSSYVHYKCSK
jgi:hypothetical protein